MVRIVPPLAAVNTAWGDVGESEYSTLRKMCASDSRIKTCDAPVSAIALTILGRCLGSTSVIDACKAFGGGSGKLGGDSASNVGTVRWGSWLSLMCE